MAIARRSGAVALSLGTFIALAGQGASSAAVWMMAGKDEDVGAGAGARTCTMVGGGVGASRESRQSREWLVGVDVRVCSRATAFSLGWFGMVE